MFPPGPPGYPIIGNLLDMPAREQPKAFWDMTAQYGMLYQIFYSSKHI